MLDIIKSMYNNVKTRVRHNGCLGEPFTSNTGVRQGECLSPFLFSVYLNDLEAELATKMLPGIDIGTINIYLVMYVDGIILFGKTPDELQRALTILEEYCSRWKLTVNTGKQRLYFERAGDCVIIYIFYSTTLILK